MIYKNAKIIRPDETIINGFIEIDNGKITNIGSNYHGDNGIDLEGKSILPGFIDFHIHGSNGSDVMDCTHESLETMVVNLPSDGTTSFLATTLTMELYVIKNAIKNIVDYKSDKLGANLIGIHLEGPFINNKFKGAQNEKYLLEPSVDIMEELLAIASGRVKAMTYAVEKADLNFTRYLKENNIVPSVGHSSATMSEVLEHSKVGLSNITHMHNGQSPHHHRNPGVVSAGLFSDDIYSELIVDGVHLHPDTVRLVLKVKGRDKILLISDSMMAKGLENGIYSLGGLEVAKNDTEVRTESGSLAGSILKLNVAVKNMIEFTGCSLNDISVMTSLNQAKLLGLDDFLGKVEKGYNADLVILDDDYSIYKTICNGIEVYSK
ncbi:N-acetylglucosamine-6-phosphate deacetylase [Mycoplasmatota bacterium WC44]